MRDVPAEMVIKSLMPYFCTGDRELRKSLHEVLDYYFVKNSSYRFDIAKEVIFSSPDESINAFSDYMFERAPAEAFRFFVQSSPHIDEHRRRALLTSAEPVLQFLVASKSHRISCAQTESSVSSGLLFLATQRESWIQKLVDVVIAECPKLRTGEIRNALEEKTTRRNGVPVEPNEDIQSFMRTWCSPDLDERRKLFPDETTESELHEKLLELQSKAGGTEKLVAQLLYFRVHARSTMEAMLPLVAMERLGISADDKSAGILPFLETEDKSVLSEAYEWLEGIDYNRTSREYEFDRYKDTIQAKTPQGLIRYMYSKSPDVALATIASAKLSSDDAEALVKMSKSGNEEEALDVLSKRPEWWVQLYVAKKVQKNPKLRTPAILERLNKSESSIVVKAINEKK